MTPNKNPKPEQARYGAGPRGHLRVVAADHG